MELPEPLADDLNELGFVRTETGSRHVFFRTAIASEITLTIVALGADTWQAGMAYRPTFRLGKTQSATGPVALGRLGRSSDGMTLEFPSDEMLVALPRLLRESILPMIDAAPT